MQDIYRGSILEIKVRQLGIGGGYLMKKMLLFLLTVLLLFALCACSSSSTTYTIEKHGRNFEVNLENNTIFDGKYTYQYTFSGDSSSYSIDIIYPNGSIYYWNHSGNSGHGGWSDDYNENLYVAGDILCDIVIEKAPETSNSGKVIAIIFLLGIGVFNTAAPSVAWYLEYGWRYKNADPSDFALGLNRVGGIIAIIVGVFIIFLS